MSTSRDTPSTQSLPQENAFLAPAHTYAQGLSDALLCVVRISVYARTGAEQHGTGWLLTPDLVLCPGFMLKIDRFSTEPAELQALVFTAFDGVDVAWEQVIEAQSEIELLDFDEAPRTPLHSCEIALVKLKYAVSIPQLHLRASAPGLREPVSMLAFVGGNEQAMLSQGQLLEPGDHAFRYDAYSRSESSGAPVFDTHWQVLGLHMGSLRPVSPESFGLDLDTLLALFQRSRHWPDIARYYRLADLLAGGEALGRDAEPVTSPSSVSAVLLRAAVSAAIDPASVESDEREVLRHLVIDSDADMWILLPEVRRNVLGGSASLAELREQAPGTDDSAAQRMVARILKGPPYVLAEIPDDELSWWLQGAYWYAGVAPDLPTTAQVERVLQRRRLRGRLDAIAGADFLGRDAELQVMRGWFGAPRQQPVYVWGIGGVGKSALVARFAQELPASSVLLWLDFDRADIAADDAPSVIAAIYAQARVQLDGFDAPTGEIEGARWEQAAEVLALALAQAGGATPMLLVLDSFEVAQHVERYQELWPLLERLTRHLPTLRIVISGRAPLPTLSLNGEAALEISLCGLNTADATTWLARHGVVAQPIVDVVMRLSRGLPLILHLAVQLVDSGGDVDDVPRDLPDRIVAGFLYDRILGRIQDAAIKPLAQASLVLRRLSADLLEPLFGDLIDLPSRPASEWISAFAREVALVEGDGVLRLRDEIRTPALELLQRSDPSLVHTIDARAERLYSALDTRDPELAAELVYHRLRLDNVAGAQAAWCDGCGSFLYNEPNKLSDTAAEWLSGRLGTISVVDTDLTVWELDAAERIRAARGRGLDRIVAEILMERNERSAGSPLFFHEAFNKRERGDYQGALDVIARLSSPNSSKRVRLECAMLEALVLSDAGKQKESDRVLQRWCSIDHWNDRNTGSLEHAAVLAARIRRNTDFSAELSLAQYMEARSDRKMRVPLASWISWLDVMIPELEDALEHSRPFSQIDSVSVYQSRFDRQNFFNNLEKFRSYDIADAPEILTWLRRQVFDGHDYAELDWPDTVPTLLARVLECAWRRWTVIADKEFLSSFISLGEGVRDYRLSRAILSVHALVARIAGLELFFYQNGRVKDALDLICKNVEKFTSDIETEIDEKIDAIVLAQEIREQSRRRSNLSDAEIRQSLLRLYLNAEDSLVPLVDGFAGFVRRARRS